MSDFAFEYFNRELDNLDVPALTKIFEKVKKLLAQKKKAEKPFARQLGGLEKGFYMASDFDDTPECFKEALQNDFCIITRDTIIPKYPVKTLW